MKTYSETKNIAPFNWFAFLNERIERKDSISEKEQKRMVKKAKSWVTCACGNQCAVLDREKDGTPFDEKLEDWGVEFWDCIMNEDWAKGKRVLSKIEKRSSKLIAVAEKEAIRKLTILGYKFPE